MTQEQYNRAVEINDGIIKCRETRSAICDFLKNYPIPDAISCIIMKHFTMILNEIDAEIEKLKKEIEAL